MPGPIPFDDALVRLAFDLSPSGMLAVDSAGAIVAANREAERLFGWPREELIGRSIEELVPERFRGRHPGHRSAFMGDPHARPMGAGRDLFGLRRDGTEFPVEIGLNPVTSDRGRFVLASVVDISARRELEDNLRRAQKLEAVGVLAGGIAHDFNNILLGIVGHAELVLREASLGPQNREDLERVLKAAERGRTLVQRILQFSRDTQVARKPLRLEHALAEVIQLLRASLPSTVEILAALDPVTPAVLSDETQLHQIVMNLATNAAHAMPDGGRLEIRVTRFDVGSEFVRAHPGMEPGPHARITVSDTGTGMPPEVLERVPEPFFTTKPPGQGTGLGLSIVHGIVRAHRGVLEIESAPGRGTAVRITLPAASPPATGPATAAADAPAGRALHVLFVDDERVLALMQRRQLEHLGYEVTVHTSSVEALEDFRSRPDAFSLLITDDTMPRMTGRALAREVLAIRPGLPVLMVSGGDAANRESLASLGIGGILRKPHSADELDQAIREVLRDDGGAATREGRRTPSPPTPRSPQAP
jgi:PAS domain S-box-containing protein